MKKLLYVGLIVLGTLSLPSCGGETKTDDTTTTVDSATTTESMAPDTTSMAAPDTAMTDTTKH